MSPFKLGDRVYIPENGRNGKIVGIWEDIDGATTYRIRYADEDGVLHKEWIDPSSIEQTGEPIEEPVAT